MNKIMRTDSMDNIVDRLKGCTSLIYLLCEVAENSCIPSDALRGVGDLLESICKDFQADIGNANDFYEKAVAK